MNEYYKMLEKNRELFNRAYVIALEIKNKARRFFEDCEVYIIGSYAKKEHTLSSDLDILIVSEKIPEKINFEWYSKIVKALTDDWRVNIHLVNKRKFNKKLYSQRLPIL